MNKIYIFRKATLNVLLFMLIILFIFPGYTKVGAQKIRVGLFHDKNINSVVFSIVEGFYQVRCNGHVIMKIQQGEIFYLSADNNNIQFSSGNKKFGGYNKIELEGIAENNTFQLKPVSPLLLSADYDGDLSITYLNSQLQIINHVDLDKYVSGVIEAEGGPNALPEYYKAQAILVRTYAIKNMYRHATEGYNLCSSEHCQAYKGRSMLNRNIYEATHSTGKLVLADRSGELIIAPYHSNCGGITSTADLAWQARLPCLHSVNDPFCSSGKNYSWSKQMNLSAWNNYLESNGIKNVNHSPDGYITRNPIRQKYLKVKNANIAMRKIREDFNLKSSFFAIEKKGNDIVFKGKGYGHGVGLCQEGAMEMARVGYTYIDILHFYYQNVRIISYHNAGDDVINNE